MASPLKQTERKLDVRSFYLVLKMIKRGGER